MKRALACLGLAWGLLACSRSPGEQAPTPSAQAIVTASAAPSSGGSSTHRSPGAPASVDPAWDAGHGEPVHVAIQVSRDGFAPVRSKIVQGRPAFLDFTRTEESNCVNAVKMPWSEEVIDLPLDKLVSVRVPDTSRLGEFDYACWMNMVVGHVSIVAAADAGD